MTKKEFLAALSARLSGISPEEKSKILQYYDEIISDRVEDGIPEHEAVNSLGSMDSIINNIKSDIPIPDAVPAQRIKEKGGSRAVWIVLAIIGSPIWLPLLFALLMIVFAIFMVIISLIISLFAFLISLGITCLAGIIKGVFLAVTGSPAAGLCCLGIGLICGSLLLFLIFPVWAGIRGLIRLMGILFKKIKSAFFRKKGTVL